MKTKVTDRRFPGCAAKEMAPVIMPSVNNLCDLYFTEENSTGNVTSYDVIEIGLDNEVITISDDELDKVGEKSPPPSVEIDIQPRTEQPRKRKLEKTEAFVSKRKKSMSPLYVDARDIPYWEVECIVGKRTVDNQPQYLVKWKGFSEKENTWEPMSSFHPLTMDCIWNYEHYLEKILKEAKENKSSPPDVTENSVPEKTTSSVLLLPSSSQPE